MAAEIIDKIKSPKGKLYKVNWDSESKKVDAGVE